MPSIKESAQKLKSILTGQEPPAFLLIVCPDRTRRERAVHTLGKKFISNYDERSGRADTLRTISAAELTSSNFPALQDESNTLSLFASKKFFHLSLAEELKSDLNKKLIALLEALNPTSYWILTAAKLAANSQLYNFFKKKGALLELPELKGLELNRWVQKELKVAGLTEWDDSLIEAIIHAGDSSPDKCVDLIERLALFVEGAKATIEDLSQISKQSPQSNEFALLEMIATRKPLWQRELLMEQILLSGKNPFALLALFSRTYSNYLRIAALREKGHDPQEIRQKLNISPWLFNKQSESSRRYSVRQLKSALRTILTADSRLKNRSLGEEVIFSELINTL